MSATLGNGVLQSKKVLPGKEAPPSKEPSKDALAESKAAADQQKPSLTSTSNHQEAGDQKSLQDKTLNGEENSDDIPDGPAKRLHLNYLRREKEFEYWKQLILDPDFRNQFHEKEPEIKKIIEDAIQKNKNGLNEWMSLLNHAPYAKNDSSKDGKSLLHHAIDTDFTSFVQMILQITINATKERRNALYPGEKEIKITLDNIGLKDNDFLFYAVHFGKLEMVKLLLQFGGNPIRAEGTGYRKHDIEDIPVHCALKSDHPESTNIIKCMINENTEISFALLNAAIQIGNIEKLKLLLNGKVNLISDIYFDLDNVDDKAEHPLLTAVKKGSLDCVKLIIEKRNEAIKKSFEEAKARGEEAASDEIDLRNIMRNVSLEQQAFNMAIKDGKSEIAEFLLKSTTPVNRYKIILSFIEQGNEHVVRSILSQMTEGEKNLKNRVMQMVFSAGINKGFFFLCELLTADCINLRMMKSKLFKEFHDFTSVTLLEWLVLNAEGPEQIKSHSEMFLGFMKQGANPFIKRSGYKEYETIFELLIEKGFSTVIDSIIQDPNYEKDLNGQCLYDYIRHAIGRQQWEIACKLLKLFVRKTKDFDRISDIVNTTLDEHGYLHDFQFYKKQDPQNSSLNMTKTFLAKIENNDFSFIEFLSLYPKNGIKIPHCLILIEAIRKKNSLKYDDKEKIRMIKTIKLANLFAPLTKLMEQFEALLKKHPLKLEYNKMSDEIKAQEEAKTKAAAAQSAKGKAKEKPKPAAPTTPLKKGKASTAYTLLENDGSDTLVHDFSESVFGYRRYHEIFINYFTFCLIEEELSMARLKQAEDEKSQKERKQVGDEKSKRDQVGDKPNPKQPEQPEHAGDRKTNADDHAQALLFVGPGPVGSGSKPSSSAKPAKQDDFSAVLQQALAEDRTVTSAQRRELL